MVVGEDSVLRTQQTLVGGNHTKDASGFLPKNGLKIDCRRRREESRQLRIDSCKPVTPVEFLADTVRVEMEIPLPVSFLTATGLQNDVS